VNYFFRLNMSAHECEILYTPGINSVVMTAESGQRIQVPTPNLRPFVTRTGIRGRFRLMVNEQLKIQSFEKVC